MVEKTYPRHTFEGERSPNRKNVFRNRYIYVQTMENSKIKIRYLHQENIIVMPKNKALCAWLKMRMSGKEDKYFLL